MPAARAALATAQPIGVVRSYYYNDTNTAQQYMAAVPASKVILGVPYYGRKACVPAATATCFFAASKPLTPCI